jgi:hypothetical protein
MVPYFGIIFLLRKKTLQTPLKRFWTKRWFEAGSFISIFCFLVVSCSRREYPCDLPIMFCIVNIHSFTGPSYEKRASLAKWHLTLRYRAIPFNIHTPLWTRISEGVWKRRFWGVVCIGILWSLRFFWGVRQKFLNFWGGCLCRHFDLFFWGVQILLTSYIGGCVY